MSQHRMRREGTVHQCYSFHGFLLIIFHLCSLLHWLKHITALISISNERYLLFANCHLVSIPSQHYTFQLTSHNIPASNHSCGKSKKNIYRFYFNWRLKRALMWECSGWSRIWEEAVFDWEGGKHRSSTSAAAAAATPPAQEEETVWAGSSPIRAELWWEVRLSQSCGCARAQTGWRAVGGRHRVEQLDTGFFIHLLTSSKTDYLNDDTRQLRWIQS